MKGSSFDFPIMVFISPNKKYPNSINDVKMLIIVPTIGISPKTMPITAKTTPTINKSNP